MSRGGGTQFASGVIPALHLLLLIRLGPSRDKICHMGTIVPRTLPLDIGKTNSHIGCPDTITPHRLGYMVVHEVCVLGRVMASCPGFHLSGMVVGLTSLTSSSSYVFTEIALMFRKGHSPRVRAYRIPESLRSEVSCWV
ncbi:hypothetical protein F5Y06DRAFT_147241 [Hypoxylon sp. FL0890]|nr:hypothetical protein F5Y06DRAFT_147241 [Hypoxylon sp. FL0890]